MSGVQEDIPELVSVFLWNHKKGPYSDDCMNDNFSYHCSAFDYRAATELLKKDPDQVQYVTYESKSRRGRSNVGAIFGKVNYGYLVSNPFLHSPLRWACLETTKEAEAMEFLTMIRDIDPTKFLEQDSDGDLPIDGECILNASLKVIEFLLEIYLDYDFDDFDCPNGGGMMHGNFNPITCLCGSYWWEDIKSSYQDIRSGAYTVCRNNLLENNLMEDNLGIDDDFWERIILLTKAFYHKTITEVRHEDGSIPEKAESMLRIVNEYGDRRVRFRLLHACAGIDWFPPNLLRLLVTAFPKALLEADEHGNLPIHVAAVGFFESYKVHNNDDARWESQDFEANSGYQKSTIDILLEANPDLAKIPDAEGRLPLELAIENKIKNHSKEGSEFLVYSQRPQTKWRPWEDGGIGSLLKAYPEAAKIRSPVTGMLPLETTLGKCSNRDWGDGIEELLNAYPEAANQRNPITGKYPLQLATERETHFDEGIYGLLNVFPKAIRDIPHSGQIPLFAHSASENCSVSVIYKLLKMNPESCRPHNHKTLWSEAITTPVAKKGNRKRRSPDLKQFQTTTDDRPIWNKRCKSLLTGRQQELYECNKGLLST